MVVVVALLMVGCRNHISPNTTLLLWPEGVEESNSLEGMERKLEGGRIENVSEPRMEVFLPADPNGMFIVVCPGGAYARLAAYHEGVLVPEWLNERGIGAGVLYYRMPNGHSTLPLKDAERALALVRQNADEWGVDRTKVGIMGFSAGGHLAATALTKLTCEEQTCGVCDHGCDPKGPNFGVLFYPVVSMRDGLTHAVSRTNLLGANPTEECIAAWSADEQVTARTPRTILFHSADDKSVPIANSERFVAAMEAAGVECQLHTYPTGGHGWGWESEKFDYHSELFATLQTWLDGLF